MTIMIPAGPPGMNAYQLAVVQGFVGSFDDWLQTFHGADGLVAPATKAEVLAGRDADKAVTPDSLGALSFPIFPDDGGGSGTFDANFAPILWYKDDGSVVPGYDEFIPFVDDAGLVTVRSDTLRISIASVKGAVKGAPRLNRTYVRWIDENGGAEEMRHLNLAGGMAMLSGKTRLVGCPKTGQSLSVKTNSGLPISTTPPAPTKAFMFSTGTWPMQDAVHEVPTAPYLILDSQLDSLVPLVETLVANSNTLGESTGAGQAAVLAPTLGDNEAMVYATFGVGGANIDQIGPDTLPDRSLLRGVEKWSAWAKLTGAILEVPGVDYDQGESNYPNDNQATVDTFVDKWDALGLHLSTSIRAILGANGHPVPANIPLIFWSPSSWCVYGNAAGSTHYNGNIVAAMVARAIANPDRFIMLGPQYWLVHFIDGLHEDSLGYRKLGEYEGRAKAALRAGQPVPGVWATNVNGTGTGITISYRTLTQIAIDAVNVTDPGQLGFRLVDNTSGAEIALSDFAPSGFSDITATTATALVAGRSYTLTYAMQTFEGVKNGSVPAVPAGPTSGPRGCIRDTSADTFSALAGGGRMFDWSQHQILTFNAI